MANKKTFLDRYGTSDQNLMDMLAAGLLGFAGNNVPEMAQKQQAFQAEQEFRNWQMSQQGKESDIKMAQSGLVPNPNGDILIGGQRYSRQPPIMPDFSKLGIGGGGLGLTGASFDPISGETKLNIGQLPQDKARIENEQRQSKELETATQDWKGGKAFLNIIKQKFLETKPPKTGMLGIGGAGILPQPLYGVQQKLGSLAQWTDNQKKDNLYISYVNALKSRLAKGGIIGKDVGNLSVQEQQWVMEGIPSIMDYKDVGTKKIDNMLDMLDEMYKARKAGYKDLTEMLSDKGQNYFKGQIINKNGKSYKIVGGDLVNDPNIEEMK